jgi:rSAM/selenodomain-associated transferase 2
MFLSIIIPTLNEAENLTRLIPRLRDHLPRGEILVIDGGSEDRSLEVARSLGAKACCAPRRGRAAQMNFGAEQAKGEVLYFVHADTLPPNSYYQDIEQALQTEAQVGSYRSSFDRDHPLLRVNAYLTRYDRLFCRGGDQSIFTTRRFFEAVHGYREDFLIMEDFDFIQKARRQGVFHIFDKDILISARKYDHNSYLRVNLANLVIVIMYLLGVPQPRMVKAYQWMLNYR